MVSSGWLVYCLFNVVIKCLYMRLVIVFLSSPPPKSETSTDDQSRYMRRVEIPSKPDWFCSKEASNVQITKSSHVRIRRCMKCARV